MFERGELNGTIHACIGQEMSALSVCKHLGSSDFVFSNHRCHGHFLALTGDDKGLIAELMGRRTGVCGGVGGSQHLFVKDRFYSNGIQGGIVPVAMGRALAEKLKGSGNIGVVFIGDGTLGQGVVYESLNIMSKWGVPLLVVVENNQYAQSTSLAQNLAGSIADRFKAFNVPIYEGSTTEWQALAEEAKYAIDHVRNTVGPAALIVNTYRLCSHSKSDDCRSQEEIDCYALVDPINVWAKENPELFTQVKNEAVNRVQSMVSEIAQEGYLGLDEYFGKSDRESQISWNDFLPLETHERLALTLNHGFSDIMDANDKILFIGEDVKSPYGGAFKIAQGLSERFPDRVFSTPISEQAITGAANGLALGGYHPILEFMFGDFVTLGFDQIVNHASKFRHMYNHGVDCPIIIRAPMGGHRGYGPTHSQTLDKFLAGIDNVKLLALNLALSPHDIYSKIIDHERDPVVVIENKADYARKMNYGDYEILSNYLLFKSDARYPAILFEPVSESPDVCIITYGGNMDAVLQAAQILFLDHEILCSVLVLTQIYPISHDELIVRAPRVYVVEEGSVGYGFGSEVVAILSESGGRFDSLMRIGSESLPIPAVRRLENQVLVGVEKIVNTIAGDCHG